MYWAKSLTPDAFRRAVAHSTVVVEAYRGRGLSKRMVAHIVNHPDLRGLRRFLLVTEDAQGLYAQFGFEPLADHGHWMQIYNG